MAASSLQANTHIKLFSQSILCIPSLNYLELQGPASIYPFVTITWDLAPETGVPGSTANTVLQLMREAEVHLGQLTSMLRSPGVASLPGTVAIVAVKAAHSIALHRPFFISKVLPVLLGLGTAQVS